MNETMDTQAMVDKNVMVEYKSNVDPRMSIVRRHENIMPIRLSIGDVDAWLTDTQVAVLEQLLSVYHKDVADYV
jgi:hypothetical protein